MRKRGELLGHISTVAKILEAVMDKLPTIGVFLAILLLESARLSVLRALTSWVLSFFFFFGKSVRASKEV